MPERSLPTGYTRIKKNLIGRVVESITVNPRSRGLLFLPGQCSASARPPAHQVKLVSTAVDNQGVSAEPIRRGTSDVHGDLRRHRPPRQPSFRLRRFDNDQCRKEHQQPSFGVMAMCVLPL
jgi:hypothetical protein